MIYTKKTGRVANNIENNLHEDEKIQIIGDGDSEEELNDDNNIELSCIEDGNILCEQIEEDDDEIFINIL